MTALPEAGPGLGGDWVRVCAVEDVPPAGAVRVEIGSLAVAVVRTEDEEVYAILDICSHADVPLSEGEVDGTTLECWLHGSRFDLRTGRPTGLPATRPVPVFPTAIDDGDVYVRLDKRIDVREKK
jgi:3-phenylpropionate/trans-cinnamate dioxygenase ferredoxin component